MKYFLLIPILLVVYKDWAQCPYPDTIVNSTGHCLGGALTIDGASAFSKIVWYKDGVPIDSSVVDPTFVLHSHIAVAGGHGLGSAANQLDEPTQIVVDGKRSLYILDTRNSRVQEWMSGSATGITVAGGNQAGSQANQLDIPVSLAVDRQGNVYVGEQGANRVTKWAPGATQGVTVAGGNGPGSANNQLSFPAAILVDCQGNLYIDDVFNQRIQLWTPGATSGITLVANDGIPPMPVLTGMGMDAMGNIYVLDPPDQSVRKWTPGTTTLVTVAGGNGIGAGDNQLYEPAGLYVDMVGDLYISDSRNQRIQYWAAGATTGKTLADITSADGNDIQDAIGIYVDAMGSLYVCERGNSWVEQFNSLTFLSDPQYVPTSPGSYTAVGFDVNGGVATTSPFVLGDNGAATTVRISPSDTAICTGQPLNFTATASNAAEDFIYQWQINGKAAGSDTTVFTSNALPDGAVIDCIVTDPGSCGPVSSDTTIVQVNPYPQITSPLSYSVPAGQPVTLHTTATGDELSYAWSPSTGLSDTTLSDPVARLNNSIDYTLVVTGKGGCSVSRQVEVDVITPLLLPSAFTPNGDGHNDILYVLQASQGSRIEEFAIFDRWGQRVFQVHDGMPGDRTAGWDGRVNGKEGPAGVYVYEILLQLSDGHRQSYKGTVVLVR